MRIIFKYAMVAHRFYYSTKFENKIDSYVIIFFSISRENMIIVITRVKIKLERERILRK